MILEQCGSGDRQGSAGIFGMARPESRQQSCNQAGLSRGDVLQVVGGGADLSSANGMECFGRYLGRELCEPCGGYRSGTKAAAAA